MRVSPSDCIFQLRSFPQERFVMSSLMLSFVDDFLLKLFPFVDELLLKLFHVEKTLLKLMTYLA